MCYSKNYEFYKKHHICVRCGQEDAERNHTLCFRCMIKNRESSIAYHKKHKNERIEKKREINKIRYYKLKQLGICTSCGKRKTKYNKVYCEFCNARRNERYRRKYLLNIYATKNMIEIRI